MKRKFFVCLLLLHACIYVSKAQIGIATLGNTDIANATVGNSSNLGASSLPVCAPRSVSCSNAFTYIFIGNGSWGTESNWKHNAKPPVILPAGAQIIINPVSGGECILNTPQTIAAGAKLQVAAGKKFKVLTNITIQN